MAIVQILKTTHSVDDRMKAVFEGRLTVFILSLIFLNIFAIRWEGNKENYGNDGNER